MWGTRLDGNDVLEDTISSVFWFIFVLVMGNEEKNRQNNVETSSKDAIFHTLIQTKNLVLSSYGFCQNHSNVLKYIRCSTFLLTASKKNNATCLGATESQSYTYSGPTKELVKNLLWDFQGANVHSSTSIVF